MLYFIILIHKFFSHADTDFSSIICAMLLCNPSAVAIFYLLMALKDYVLA